MTFDFLYPLREVRSLFGLTLLITNIAFLSISVIMSYVVVVFWMGCVPNAERLMNPVDLKALDSNSLGSWAVYFVCFLKELVVLENV